MSTEENKARVHRLIEDVWNRHDVEALPEYFAPHLLEEVTTHFRELVAAFPDLRVTIEEPGLVAEGDLVAMRLTVSGTHTGAPFAGVDPGGEPMSWISLRIQRLESGKVTQTWAMQDRLGLFQQLGLVEERVGKVQWADAEGEE